MSSKTPLLMLPPQVQELEEDQPARNSELMFFSIDQHTNTLTNTHHQSDHQVLDPSHRCIGSSHGWLIVLDHDANPYLKNPFSPEHIKLPFTETFPNILCFSKENHNDGFCFLVKYVYEDDSMVSRRISTLKEAQKSLVSKAVLSESPCDYDSTVVAITDFDSNVVFCKVRGEDHQRSWNVLERKPADDIMCNEKNMLFVLSKDGSIQVWNLKSASEKPMQVYDLLPCFSGNNSMPDLDPCSSRSYLVEALSGDLLLVQRFVGEFVNDDGLPVREADLLDGPTNQPLVCPYRTVRFQVYKLDHKKCEWKDMRSIGKQVIFLGGNHSVCMRPNKFSGTIRGLIYFTDDYWLRADEDYMYGGHDIGVFNLRDGCVTQFHPRENNLRLDPPPFWLLPC